MTQLNMEEIYHLAIEELILNESIKVEEYQNELESNVVHKIEEYYAMQLSRIRDEEHQIRDQLRVNYQNSIAELRNSLINQLLQLHGQNLSDRIRNTPSLQREYFGCLIQLIPIQQEITKIWAPKSIHDQLHSWAEDNGRTIEIKGMDEMGLKFWLGDELFILDLQTILSNNCDEIIQHILTLSNDN